MLKIVHLVTGFAALLLSFSPSLAANALTLMQQPSALCLALFGLLNLILAPQLPIWHAGARHQLQNLVSALLILGSLLQALILLAPLELIANQPASLFSLLIIDAFNPLDHRIFQNVFGMVMTLLIAMEFKHSIVRVALRRDSIIQVKTVILIGLIALSRKIVILDPDVSPAKVAALAGATLALGLTYWLLRERDDRVA